MGTFLDDIISPRIVVIMKISPIQESFNFWMLSDFVGLLDSFKQKMSENWTKLSSTVTIWIQDMSGIQMLQICPDFEWRSENREKMSFYVLKI